MTYLTALAMLMLPIDAASLSEEHAPPTAERVTFTTSDGVEIVADYYKPKGEKRRPCVICVHMYRAERTSWQPLAALLVERGFAVLAYDIRGAGESILPREKALSRLYGDRDSELFAAAWRDAEAAAKWLAGRKECDTTRLVLIGASVGCSISLDYAARSSDVRGVACLSPGLDYMGIDSLAHIRKLKGRPVLLVCPEGEQSAAKRLAKAGGDAVKVDVHPGGEEQHGTRMFDADDGRDVMVGLADFALEHTRPAKGDSKK